MGLQWLGGGSICSDLSNRAVNCESSQLRPIRGRWTDSFEVSQKMEAVNVLPAAGNGVNGDM